MSDFGKISTAILVGAIAGAVVGVLFAPDRGSETRRKISEKSQDLIDQLSDKIDEGMGVLSSLRKKAENIKDKYTMEGEANSSRSGRPRTSEI